MSKVPSISQATVTIGIFGSQTDWLADNGSLLHARRLIVQQLSRLYDDVQRKRCVCLLICSRGRCRTLAIQHFFGLNFHITCPMTANHTHYREMKFICGLTTTIPPARVCVSLFHFPISVASTTCEIKFLDHFASNISQLLNSRRVPRIAVSRLYALRMSFCSKHEHIINRNQSMPTHNVQADQRMLSIKWAFNHAADEMPVILVDFFFFPLGTWRLHAVSSLK